MKAGLALGGEGVLQPGRVWSPAPRSAGTFTSLQPVFPANPPPCG